MRIKNALAWINRAWHRAIGEIKVHPTSFHIGNSASLFMASMLTLLFGGWRLSLVFLAGGLLTLEMAFIEYQKLRPRQKAKKSRERR